MMWYVLKVKKGKEYEAKKLLEARDDVEKVIALCDKKLVVYKGRKVIWSVFLDKEKEGEVRIEGVGFRIRKGGVEDFGSSRIENPGETLNLGKLKAKIVVENRIFDGYILVKARISDDLFFYIEKFPFIYGFLTKNGKPACIDEEDLNKMLRKVRKMIEETSETITEGSFVSIEGGTFAGMKGRVVKIEGNKATILVDLAGTPAPIPVKVSYLKKLL